MAKNKILVLDDDNLICWSLKTSLEQDNHQVVCFSSGKEALGHISKDSPDLILLDLMLPDISGEEILKKLREVNLDVPIVVITARTEVASAVNAMKLGAVDYFCKPFDLEEIKITVRKILEMEHLKSEIYYRRAKEKSAYSFDQVICSDPRMVSTLNMARKIANSETMTILIQGESGTGKDLLAKAIHYESRRASHPLIEISCTAMPEHLLESELFGHERGAFTDAKKMKRGLFEIADGGSIVFEEIGDMPLNMQAKLLKVLEDRKFRRIGGVKTIDTDVRIIATTNKILQEEVRKGKFRLDLFYRLQVVTLTLPPLRERKADILPLAYHFIRQMNPKFNKNIQRISPAAEKLLLHYNWPGNVRQLKNTLERAMIFIEGEELSIEQLPIDLSSVGPSSSPDLLFKLPPEGIPLEEIEKQAVIQAIRYTKGNQIRAAKLLGISRDSLRRKLKKYGLI